jgi:hypothetical protein
LHRNWLKIKPATLVDLSIDKVSDTIPKGKHMRWKSANQIAQAAEKGKYAE